MHKKYAKENLPSFIIIGAQKAGTTSLYNDITQHPKIFRAKDKEPSYFNVFYDKGLDWYKSFFKNRKPTKVPDIRNGGIMDPLRYGSRDQITGEATPLYLTDEVQTRIKDLIPHVKIIALLRDPIKRAWSGYQHNRYYRPKSENRDFLTAVSWELPDTYLEEKKNFKGRKFPYLSTGLYAEHLKRWYQVFDKEQILVIDSERYFKNRLKCCHLVLEFLGLEKFNPMIGFHHMKGKGPQINQEDYLKLKNFYIEANKELKTLIGEFSWMKNYEH